MKKGLIVIAALILAMSVAGCGKRQKIQIQHLSRLRRQMRRVHTKTAVQQKLLTVRTIQRMSIWRQLKVQRQNQIQKADSYSGEVSNNDISIEEAKLINYDDSDVVVVSFEFTNKTDSDQSFSGVYDIVAEQNGSSLAPATVIGVDGVELLTLSQNIAPGETITVQKRTSLTVSRHRLK